MFCVLLKGDPGRLILSFCSFLLVWKLENVCECMCIELKADLMSCEAVELRHGSVTHHRTFGSHGGLIIRGILWSLSIIKINHHPAAGRLSVVVCGFSALFVFLSFSLLTISPCLFIFLPCSFFLSPYLSLTCLPWCSSPFSLRGQYNIEKNLNLITTEKKSHCRNFHKHFKYLSHHGISVECKLIYKESL